MQRVNFKWAMLFLVVWEGLAANAQPKPLNHFKPDKQLEKTVDNSLRLACDQYRLMMRQLPEGALPGGYDAKNVRLWTIKPSAWTSGFYPGVLLYLYEYSKDTVLLHEALARMGLLEQEQYNKSTHDLGFMMYCSYGNAYRILGKEDYKNILVQSARSLATRFNPRVGLIKSWNRTSSLDGKSEWKFPVIIDNMINLELLFFASRVTGDTSYRDIAVTHAITTIKNHFRPDYSTYHVVDYDPETGLAVHHESHQGFADNSTWSRGQAWAIYGYTMAYRETGDPQFLEIACKAADYYLNNKRLPADKIPYWDFNANEPGYTPRWKRAYDPHELSYIPRDASAGAIVTAALLELSGYTDPHTGKRYFHAAETMLRALSSSGYLSPPGSNGGFVLEHCVGSFPGKSSVDTPLPYGDYYYVQALMRYRDLLKN